MSKILKNASFLNIQEMAEFIIGNKPAILYFEGRQSRKQKAAKHIAKLRSGETAE